MSWRRQKEVIRVNNLSETGLVGRLFEFDIDASEAGKGCLEIEINDGSTKCVVNSLGSRRFHASFLPHEAVPHVIEMKFNGKTLPESPFIIDIRERGYIVSEPALQRVPINKPTTLMVCTTGHTADRHTNVVSATITSPSGSQLELKIVKKDDGTCLVEYIPVEVGTHTIDVSRDGRVVSGSPYSSEAYDISAVVVSTVSDYSKGKITEFEIDTSEAGDGELEVMILCEENEDNCVIPHTVTLLDKGIYLVSFTAFSSKPSYAVISFNRKELPQSPFTLYSPSTAQHDLLVQAKPGSSIYDECSTGSEISEPLEILDTSEETNEDLGQRHSVIRDHVATGLKALQACTIEREQYISVVRQGLVGDLLELYKDPTIASRTLSVTFEGEPGVDCMGLTRDLFTCFWRDVSKDLFRGEDCLVPDLPLHRIRKESWKFECLGRILSHTVALTGTIPSMIARSTLIKITSESEVDDECLLDDFLLFVTTREKTLLTKAMSDFSGLTDAEFGRLKNFFTAHGFNNVPKRSEIKDQILTIAYQDLVEKPGSLIANMRQGIPESHKAAFWQRLSPDDITHILQTQRPTPERVAGVIVPPKEDMTDDEDRTLYFLKEFVASLDFDTLTDFLIFVTGSVHQPDEINVTFTTLTGLDRRPVSHTCFNHLEVPTSYSSIKEFKREFLSVLASPEAFQYSEM